MKKASKKRAKELAALAALPADGMDLSDIPEVTDWSRAVIGKFYRPIKKSLTVRLDADILAWLRSEGPGYQTRINNLLRAASASDARDAMGTYITYSDVFDRKANPDDLVSTVKPLGMLDALLLLAKVNLILRFALQEHNRPNFGRVQQNLIGNFTDEVTFKKLVEKFANVSTETRPIFLPVNVLNVARAVLANSQIQSAQTTEDNAALRYALGKACLLANDLSVSAEEQRQLSLGDRDSRTLFLLVSLLPLFETLNPPAAHHLLFRYQVMFRNLLQRTSLQSRIAKECRGFDFQKEFRRVAGVPLDQWLHIAFSMYAYYLRAGNLSTPAPEYPLIAPKSFIAESKVTESDLRAVLKTVGSTLPALVSEVGAERSTDPRFDFVPFRTHPLFDIGDDRYACLDVSILLEKVHTGVHWLLHDSYISSPDKRDDLFRAWGLVFEEYVHWLLDGMQTRLSVKYFRAPSWQRGGESFDGILLQDGVLMPMEYKGGFLSRKARYSGDVREFTRDVDRKFGYGCRQLASKISALFADKESDRKIIPGLPTQHVRAIVPVLVLQDHIMRAPFVNWYLNRTFLREMSSHTLRPGTVLRPMTVVNIHELETMVESAEASSFDFVYALQHRTVRDEELRSNLQEFLMQFPTYGRERSKRAQAVFEELKGHMFSYLFSETAVAAA